MKIILRDLIDGAANLLQFVVPALLIAWADRAKRRSTITTREQN